MIEDILKLDAARHLIGEDAYCVSKIAIIELELSKLKKESLDKGFYDLYEATITIKDRTTMCIKQTHKVIGSRFRNGFYFDVSV